MSQIIFSDQQLNSAFIEQGFIKVDLLSESLVKKLIELYQGNDNLTNRPDFYATMQSDDVIRKKLISQQICEVVSDFLPKTAINYKAVFGNFLVKGPQSNYQVGIHQDWNYVDENHFRSFNVWVSLVDTNEKNGGLCVLPRSHGVNMPIRSTPFNDSIYKKYRKPIMRSALKCSLKAGQAIIYDSALIHFSSGNKTDSTRFACGCVFAPKDAELLHYYTENGTRFIYKITPDFFHKIIPGRKPDFEAYRKESNDLIYDQEALENLINYKRFYFF